MIVMYISQLSTFALLIDAVYLILIFSGTLLYIIHLYLTIKLYRKAKSDAEIFSSTLYNRT